jgi:hypothetical protein
MNAIESCVVTSPDHKAEECAKFTIDKVEQPFVISDVMVVGREYTFSCWILADTAGVITIGEASLSITSEWTYHIHTFTATSADLTLMFADVNTYYIYHPQLELGNKATDWAAAPEDVDSSIAATDEVATDAKNLATDTEGRVSSAESSLNSLGEKVENLMPISKYIDINLDGTKPYTMELGERGSESTLRLTNSAIQFMEGTFVSAYISNKKLHIDTAVIENELQIGSFVWIERSNGNVGLIWKKGGS